MSKIVRSLFYRFVFCMFLSVMIADSKEKDYSWRFLESYGKRPSSDVVYGLIDKMGYVLLDSKTDSDVRAYQAYYNENQIGGASVFVVGVIPLAIINGIATAGIRGKNRLRNSFEGIFTFLAKDENGKLMKVFFTVKKINADSGYNVTNVYEYKNLDTILERGYQILNDED